MSETRCPDPSKNIRFWRHIDLWEPFALAYEAIILLVTEELVNSGRTIRLMLLPYRSL